MAKQTSSKNVTHYTPAYTPEETAKFLAFIEKNGRGGIPAVKSTSGKSLLTPAKKTSGKRTSGNTGNRYTPEEKANILAFIEKNGRGGITAAQEKWGVSYIAIRSWKDAGLGSKTATIKSMKQVLNKVPTKMGRPAGSVKKAHAKMGRPAGSVNKVQPSVTKAHAKMGRPAGSVNKTQPKVTKRPGRPSSNLRVIKLVANIRSAMSKMGSKVASLESMLSPA